jgi:hypothetical protein
VRSIVERLRRAVTAKQPYRCHKCNHRGWYPIDIPIQAGPDAGPEELRIRRRTDAVTAEDLDRLDNR